MDAGVFASKAGWSGKCLRLTFADCTPHHLEGAKRMVSTIAKFRPQLGLFAK
jgi:hypothetical protein